jgi:hypothetical protein
MHHPRAGACRRQAGLRVDFKAAPSILALLVLGFVASCGRTKVETADNDKTVVVAEAVARQAGGDKVEAELLQALSPASEPAAETDLSEFSEEAREIMQMYPDKNAQELLNVPEVNPKLVKALQGLSKDPQLQAYMNSSVDLAAKFKGLDGPPGSYKLNLDVSVYDDGRTQRMLQAVISEKPGKVVQFLVEELGEASFEFTFTEATKTSNGISIETAGQPASSPPPAAPD